jgi:hypothetical protein
MSDFRETSVERPHRDHQPGAEAAPAPALPPPVESAPALPPPAAAAAADGLMAVFNAAVASLGSAQAAMAAGTAELTQEIFRLGRADLIASGDGIAAIMNAKNLREMVDIQLDVARRRFELMAEGSARLGEIGLHLANDAMKPALVRVSA